MSISVTPTYVHVQQNVEMHFLASIVTNYS